MTTFEISYQKNGVYQAILVNAESENTARAWFHEYKPTAGIVGSCCHYGHKKPGMPELTVPADWTPAADPMEEKEVITVNFSGGFKLSEHKPARKWYTYFDEYLREQVTRSATEAMRWHRTGESLVVHRNNGSRCLIHGATIRERDENRDYCKRVSDELDSYSAGDVRRCPCCGEIIARDWYDVGDRFQCPHCGNVTYTDHWEELSLWDYLSDVLDYEFIIDSSREFQAIRVYVTLGGPSCWIDTERQTVELRWGGESACYGLLSDTVDAVEEWGRELWEQC